MSVSALVASCGGDPAQPSAHDNVAPVAVDDDLTTNEDTTLTLSVAVLLANDTDPNGDALAVVAASTTSEQGFSVELVRGTLTYTPAPNFHGVDVFSYSVGDGRATATALVRVTVSPVDDAPVAALDALQTLEDVPLVVATSELLANDSDDDSAEWFFASASPESSQGGTVSYGSGHLTYTPAPNFEGTDTFTYTISDEKELTGVGVVRVVVVGVNDASTLVEDVLDAQEDTPLELDVSVLLANDSDVEGALILSALPETSDQGGTLTRTDESLRYTPPADFFGEDSFTYVATDTDGRSELADVRVRIAAVNDAPSFVAADVSAVEDDGPQSYASWASAVAAGPANEADQQLTFSIANNDNPALFVQQPQLDTDGTLRFTPASDAFGVAHLAAVLTDDGGNNNGGQSASQPLGFTITISGVNDAPSFHGGGDVSTLEDAGARRFVGWASSIKLGPPSEAAQTGAFIFTQNSNPGLFAVAPAVDSSGALSFTPATDRSGTAALTLKLVDSGGGALGGVDTSAPVSFNLTVGPVNDAPSFVAGPGVTVAEDFGLVSLAWASQISPGPADEAAQSLTFFLTSGDHPELFSVAPALSPAGVLTFTPAPNATGVCTLAVVLSDDGERAHGGDDSHPSQPLTITVSPQNDAPVAADDMVAGAQDVASEFGAGELLANDVDVDGPLLAISTVQSPSDQGASVTLVTGGVRYLPAPGFSGLDTFTYTVSDSAGGTDTAAVVVNVQLDVTPPVFLAGASTPHHGDLLTADEAFGPHGALAPARLLFADADMNEGAATVTMTFMGTTLVEGVHFSVTRLVNELDVHLLAPLASLGPLAQDGDLLRYTVANLKDQQGNTASDVVIEVRYDERAPIISWLETHTAPNRRAIVQFNESMDTSTSAGLVFRDGRGTNVVPEPDSPGYFGRRWIALTRADDAYYFVPRDLLRGGEEYLIDLHTFADPAGNRCSGSCNAEFVVFGETDSPVNLVRVELVDPVSDEVVQVIPRSALSPSAGRPESGIVLQNEVAGEGHELRLVFDRSLEPATTSGELNPAGPSLLEPVSASLESIATENDSLRWHSSSTNPGSTWASGHAWTLDLRLGTTSPVTVGTRVFDLYVQSGASDVTRPALTAVLGKRGSAQTPILRRSEALRFAFSELLDPGSVDAESFVVSGPSGAVPVRVELTAGGTSEVSLRAEGADTRPVLWAVGVHTVTISGLRDLATPANIMSSVALSFEVLPQLAPAPSFIDSSPDSGATSLDPSGLSFYLAFSDAMAVSSFTDVGDPAVTPRAFRVEEGLGVYSVPRKGFTTDRGTSQNRLDGGIVRLRSGSAPLRPDTTYRVTLLSGATSSDGTPLPTASGTPSVSVRTAPSTATLHHLAIDDVTVCRLSVTAAGLPAVLGEVAETSLFAGGSLRDPDPLQGWALLVSNGTDGFVRGPVFTPYIESLLTAAQTNTLIAPGTTRQLITVFQDGSGNLASLVTRIHRPSGVTLDELTPTVVGLGAGRFSFNGLASNVNDAQHVESVEVLVVTVETAGNTVVDLPHRAFAQISRPGDGTFTYLHTMAEDEALLPLSAGRHYVAIAAIEVPALVGQGGIDGTRGLSGSSAPFMP